MSQASRKKKKIRTRAEIRADHSIETIEELILFVVQGELIRMLKAYYLPEDALAAAIRKTEQQFTNADVWGIWIEQEECEIPL